MGLRTSVTGAVLGSRRKRVSAAKRRKNSLVPQKVKVLVDEGKPQRQAVAMAESMQRAGRLRPGGVYVRARKK